jgi:L-ascorbate metabolism protein UlaG (beta-lactamase superfamily)
VNDLRLTHVGGPTLLIKVGRWNLVTDPTFDPRGRMPLGAEVPIR